MNVTRHSLRLSLLYHHVPIIRVSKIPVMSHKALCSTRPSQQNEDDLDEYDDEYTDSEEFEEYNEDGVAMDNETGQPIIYHNSDLRLPVGVLFILRTFGIAIVSMTALYISWYRGRLTLFGNRYQDKQQGFIESLKGTQYAPNAVFDYKRTGDKLTTDAQEHNDSAAEDNDFESLIQKI